MEITAPPPPSSSLLLPPQKEKSTQLWRHSLRIGILLVVFNVLVIAVSIVLLVVWGDAQSSLVTEYWADALGLSAMVFSVCQFFPQILVTWRNKVRSLVMGRWAEYDVYLSLSPSSFLCPFLTVFLHHPSLFTLQSVGALSIPSILIQAPGSFLFVYSLAVRPGNNFTTWITYLCTGILQIFLLALSVYYNYQAKRQQSLAETVSIYDDDGHNNNEDPTSLGLPAAEFSSTLESDPLVVEPFTFHPVPPAAGRNEDRRPFSSRFHFLRRFNYNNNNLNNSNSNNYTTTTTTTTTNTTTAKETYENQPLLRPGFDYLSSSRLHPPSASNSAYSLAIHATTTAAAPTTSTTTTPTPDPPLASPSTSDRLAGFEQLHRLSRPMAVSTDSLPGHSLTLVGTSNGAAYGAQQQ